MKKICGTCARWIPDGPHLNWGVCPLIRGDEATDEPLGEFITRATDPCAIDRWKSKKTPRAPKRRRIHSKQR